jgi:hypothetical protein
MRCRSTIGSGLEATSASGGSEAFTLAALTLETAGIIDMCMTEGKNKTR